MSQPRKRIGQQLVEAKLLSFDQLNTAVEYQKTLGGTIGQIVVKLGFISDAELTKFLAKQYGLPIINLSEVVLPVDLFKKVPAELIEKHQIVPVHHTGRTLTIATADPTDYETIEELQYATGLQIELNLAPRAAIVKALNEFKNQSEAEQKKGGARAGKTVSQGSLEPSKAGGIEAGIIEEVRERSAGKIPTAALNKGELREALIPALIKKGVISRVELIDAVLDLLLKKGVIDQRDLREAMKDL